MQLADDPSSYFPKNIKKLIIIIPIAQEHVGIPTAPVPVPWSPLQDPQFEALDVQDKH